tara:strand:+ start:1377 stop:21518 length:20142 start_codon:yes stop_codon:yes gene_type:complete
MLALVVTGLVPTAVLAADPIVTPNITTSAPGTNIAVSGTTATVTTTNIRNDVAFNTFDQFQIGAGTTANVIQPGSTSALVNIINGGKSTIDGVLNAQIDTGGAAQIGGNHFYVNPDGFVVGASGVINAGDLTLSTPTSGFQQLLQRQAEGANVAATATLFAGTEDLSPTGTIEVMGQINARRLALRSGARMLLNGDISVVDDSSGAAGARLKPTVNARGVPQAAGISTEGGVIRLLSAGEMQLRGNITAQRKSTGGVVAAEARETLTVSSTINVQAAPGAAGDSGSVILFTEKTANLEASQKILANSIAGSGGLISVTAAEKATVRGNFEAAGGTHNERGSTVVVAAEIETRGVIATKGGDLLLFASDPEEIATADNTVGLLHIGGTTAGATDAQISTLSAVGVDRAGDIVLTGARITADPSAELTANAPNSVLDGVVVLNAVAGDQATTSVPYATDIPKVGPYATLDNAIDFEDVIATVTLEGTKIDAGAIIVNARAENITVIDEDTTLAAAEARGEHEDDANKTLNRFKSIGEDVLGFITSRSTSTLRSVLDPVDLDLSDASAKVTLRNVDFNATGDWRATPLELGTVAGVTPSAEGLLAAGGQANDFWLFAQDNPTSLAFELPQKLGEELKSRGGIYIQTHAGTTVSLGGSPFLAGITIAANSTDSQSLIEGSSLVSAGSLSVNTTASESHSLSVVPVEKFGFSAGLIVAVRDLTNQNLVLDSDLTTTGGDIQINAVSGRSHTQSVKTNSGVNGLRAASLNFGFSSALTEAAVGGSSVLSSSADIGLAAETIYYAKRHDTNTTMGIDTPLSDAGIVNLFDDLIFDKLESGAKALKKQFDTKIRGLTPEEEEEEDKKKPGIGFGLTIDLQFDHDDTFASFGGVYRDLTSEERTITDLGFATGMSGTGTFDINSSWRFATLDEGGKDLRRDVSAVTGINFAPVRVAARLFGKSEDDITAEFAKMQLFNFSVSHMQANTVAEVGKNGSVQADVLNIDAQTVYPDFAPVDRFITNLNDLGPAIASYFKDPDEYAGPEIGDVMFGIEAAINPAEAVTTFSSARAVAPTPRHREEDVGDQKFALGITTTVFNTDNTTVAAIREGGTVYLSGTLSVEAMASGTFLHLTNPPVKIPLTADRVNDNIGGALHLMRAANDTRAVIEADAFAVAGATKLNAHNDIHQVLTTYAGGGAVEKAINGSAGIGVMESDTIARIDGTAYVSVPSLEITALDTSLNVNIAGAASAASNSAVGISLPINFTTRNVYAGIGTGPDGDLTGDAGYTMLETQTLDITATNTAKDIVIGLAGARTTEADAEEKDEAFADFLASDDEFAKLLTEKDKETNDKEKPGAGQSKSRTGWAISGAAALNLSLGNDTIAEIRTRSAIDVEEGFITLTAKNDSLTAASTGAVAIGSNPDQDTNAIAGSLSLAVDTRNVIARVEEARVTTGLLSLNANDMAKVINIAVGGGGTNRGKNAVAGSVAIATLTGETSTSLTNAQIFRAYDVVLNATDTSVTGGVAGAVAVNRDQQSGRGLGIGVAVNTVSRGARTEVDSLSHVSARNLALRSTSDATIYGFAISAGAGKTALAGSVVVNTIVGDAQTRFGGDLRTAIGLDGNPYTFRPTFYADGLAISATESNTITALSGAVALSTGASAKSAIGGAIAVNTIKSRTSATATNLSLDRVSAGGSSGVTGSVTAESTIHSGAVAGALTTGESTAVGIGAASNVIDATANMSFENTLISTRDIAEFSISNAREIVAVGAGAALSGKGAAGGTVLLNMILGNEAVLTLDRAIMTTLSEGIDAKVDTTNVIKSIGIGLAGGQKLGVAGTATANVITGKSGITLRDATLRTDGNLGLVVSDSSKIDSIAGGVALSGKTAAGAAIAVSTITLDTYVEGAGVTLRSGKDISAYVTGDSEIRSLAVGAGLSGKNALAGSIAIGHINTDVRVELDLKDLDSANVFAANAIRSNTVRILSGAAALSGKNGIAAAITVAVVHGKANSLVTARKITSSKNIYMAAGENSDISTGAVGAAASQGNAAGGSFNFTQVGKAYTGATDAREIEGDNDTPVASGEAALTATADEAATLADTALAEGVDLPATTSTNVAPSDDMEVNTRFTLTSGALDMDNFVTNAFTQGTITAYGGALVATAKNGAGASIVVNRNYTKASSEIILPALAANQSHLIRGSIYNYVTDYTDMTGFSVAGAAGGKTVGAAAIMVNVSSRQMTASVRGEGGRAAIRMPDDEGPFGSGYIYSGTNAVTNVSGEAYGVGAGSDNGVGGAVAVNALGDRFISEVAHTDIDTRLRDGAGDVIDGTFGGVTVENVVQQSALARAVAGGGGGKVGFGGSAAVNTVDGLLGAFIANSRLRVATVEALNDQTVSLDAVGGGVSAGGKAGIGVGVAVNDLSTALLLRLPLAEIYAQRQIDLNSVQDASIRGFGIAGAVGGKAAISGSVAYNTNTSTNMIDIFNSTLVSGGSVTIRAVNTVDFGSRGGTDEDAQKKTTGTEEETARGYNIQIAAGGKVGVGAAVTINTSASTADVVVGRSSLSAYGGDARRATYAEDEETKMDGLLIEAVTKSDMRITTVSASGGLFVGLGGIYATNNMQDLAQVTLGEDGNPDAEVSINGAMSSLTKDFFGIPQDQDGSGTHEAAGIRVNARTLNTLDSVAIAGAGGAVGGALPIVTNFIASDALISSYDTFARSHSDGIELRTITKNTLDNTLVSAAVGGAALGVAVGVTDITSNSVLTLRGSTLLAEGTGKTIILAADKVSTITSTAIGAAAGGADAGGGAVQVTTLGGRVAANVTSNESRGITQSRIEASGDVFLRTLQDTTVDGLAVGAAGTLGFKALGVSANVINLEGTAETLLTGGSSIKGRDVVLMTVANRTITSASGAGAIGNAALGIGLDYLSLSESALVEVGDDSTVEARDDLQIVAQSKDVIDTTVVSVSVGSLGGLSLSLGILDIGGTAAANAEDSDEEEEFAKAKTAVNDAITKDTTSDKGGDDAAPGDDKNTATSLAAIADGEAALAASVARRGQIDLDSAPEFHGARVIIGKNAQLNAMDDLSLGTLVGGQISQISGGGSAGGVGAVNSGNAIATVASQSAITVGANTIIGADGALLVTAQHLGEFSGDGTIADGTYLHARAILGAVSLLGAASAGVVQVNVDADATVDIDNSVVMAGVSMDSDSKAHSIEVSAKRDGIVSADLVNISVGLGAGAVGTTFATANLTGELGVTMNAGGGNGRLGATSDVTIEVEDATFANASAIGASGGILSGNGVDVGASNILTGTASLTGLTSITGRDVTVRNASKARSKADGLGVSVGALSVGATLVGSNLKTDLETDLSADTVTASRDLTVRSEILAPDTDTHSSQSYASSSAGGLISGNGAEATTTFDYDIATTVGGKLTGDEVTIESKSSGTADVDADGNQGGLLAIGAVVTKVTAPRATALVTLVRGTEITGGSEINLRAINAPELRLTAESGSGGLISGAGASGDTLIAARTSVNLLDATLSGLSLNPVAVDVAADSDIGLFGQVDSINASLAGASGANIDTNVTADSNVLLADNADITADSLKIKTRNKVDRPALADDEFNLQSGSGGGLDIAAMDSDANVTLTTGLSIGDGAKITQRDRLDATAFSIGLETDVTLIDRQKMDSGAVVPVPKGDSEIIVTATDSNLSIGKGVEISTLGGLDIYAGGRTNIGAEVFTTAYGLAGLPGASATAKYTADHAIDLASGATLTSAEDINLRAGGTETGQQGVTVKAEARAYNNTGVPLFDVPDATASAITSSGVNLSEGASVISEADIAVFADAAHRDVEAFAQGKDLYRTSAAAVGSVFTELAGEDPVNLDYEGGKSTDLSTDLVTVNGTLHAGSRNKRVYVLDTDGTLNNELLGFTAEDAEGIDILRKSNVRLAETLQAQIDVLEAQLADTGLASDEAARTRWQAELRILQSEKARADGITAPEYTFGNITAREGNIDLRADQVLGSASGSIIAPGDALIDLRVAEDAFVVINDLIIPNEEGGIVTFNDAVVASTADFRDQAAGKLGLFGDLIVEQAFTVQSGESSAEPQINVITSGDPGTLTLAQDALVQNLRGGARLSSLRSDLVIRGKVEALTPTLSAPNGSFLLFGREGLQNTSGDPRALYFDTYFSDVQDAVSNSVHDGVEIRINGRDIFIGTLFGEVEFGLKLPSTFSPVSDRASTGGQIEGKNVYIVADQLNINGPITAGIVNHNLTIREAIDAKLDSLTQPSGAQVVRLFTPGATIGNVLTSAHIDPGSNIGVSYDFANDRLVLDDIVTQGGLVDITGKIASTGGGSIQSLDGFGEIEVISHSTRDVQLGRVDSGQNTNDLTGAQGIVRITDLNTPFSAAANSGFLTTEYIRVNKDGTNLTEVRRYSSNADRFDADGDLIADFGQLLRTSTSQDGRVESYAPAAQDLVVVQTEKRVKDFTLVTTTRYNLGFDGDPVAQPPENTEIDTTNTTSDLKDAPYLVLASDPNRPSYRMTSERYSNTSTPSDSEVVSDTRILGFGTVTEHRDVTQTSEARYSHIIRADAPIQIAFRGADTADVSITVKGNALLNSPIVSQTGETTIASLKDITALSNSAFLATATTQLVASGTIGGLNGEALNLKQVAGGPVTAFSLGGGDIALRSPKGDLIFDQITSRETGGLRGDITLTAERDIRGASGAALISGRELTLESELGKIGGAFNTATQLVSVAVTGGVTATANGNVEIQAQSGDLLLRRITSRSGDIFLRAPEGSVTDGNPVEQEDIRTAENLVSLWTDQLGLIGDGATAARKAQQETALINAELARYRQYWNARNGSGTGDPTPFVEDAALKAGLLNDGLSEADYATFLADRQARHVEWNAQTAYDPTYRPALSASQQAALIEGLALTRGNLERSINAELVLRSGTTQTRIEDPNLFAAGDITITSRNSIGRALDDIRILSPVDNALSAADLKVLSSAEVGDIRTVAGSVFVAQRDDVNLEFTRFDEANRPLGTFGALSTEGDVLIGTRTALNLSDVLSNNLTLLRVDGLLSQPDAGLLQGKRLVLESGSSAGVGTPAKAINVNVLDGGALVARGAGDIILSAGTDGRLPTTGNIPVESIFTTGRVYLSALDGAITDAVISDAPRIVAQGATLMAQQIGAQGRLLGIEATDGADISLTASGKVFAKAPGDMRLSQFIATDGGVVTTPGSLILKGFDDETHGVHSLFEARMLFGESAALTVETGGGIHANNPFYSAFEGGDLTLRVGDAITSATGTLMTEVDEMLLVSRANDGPATPFTVANTSDALRLFVSQNNNPDSTTTFTNSGDIMDVTVLGHAIDLFSSTGAIRQASLLGTTVNLRAQTEIGTGELGANIFADSLSSFVSDGPTRLTLLDEAFGGVVTKSEIALGSILSLGNGGIDIAADGLAVTMSPSALIVSGGGNIDLDADSFAIASGIANIGAGDIKVAASGTIALSGAGRVEASTGRVALLSDSTIDLTRISAGASTADAITLRAAALTLADLPTDDGLPSQRLIATGGTDAGAILSLGSLSDQLSTQIAVIDAEVRSGDLSLDNLGDLAVVDASVPAGNVTLRTSGTLRLGAISSPTGRATLIANAIDGHATLPATINAPAITMQAGTGGIGQTTALRVDTLLNSRVTIASQGNATLTEVAGDLALQTATIDGALDLLVESGGLSSGIIRATGGVTLASLLGLGTEEALSLTTPELTAQTLGDLNVILNARDGGTRLGRLFVQGGIDIAATATDLTTLADTEVLSLSSDVRIAAKSLTLAGRITSAGGDVTLTSLGALTMLSNSASVEAFGTASLSAQSDLRLGRVTGALAEISTNDGSLSLIALSDPETEAHITSSGLTTLRAGSITGDVMLTTQLAALDAILDSGNLRLSNTGALALDAQAATGNLDISTRGAMVLSRAIAASGGTVTLNATGTLSGDAAMTAGRLDLASSDGDITLTLANADTVTISRAAAEQGHIALASQGTVEVGNLVAKTTLALSAGGTGLRSVATSLLSGNRVDLVATSGSIGSTTNRFMMDTSDGADIHASAPDIHLTETTGNLAIGTITALQTDILLASGAILRGTVHSATTTLRARDGIGTEKLVFLNGGSILMEASRGDVRFDIDQALSGGEATLRSVSTGGTGRVEINAIGTALTVAEGITSEDGRITLRSGDLTTHGMIASRGGDIALDLRGDLKMTAIQGDIASQTGAITLDIAGNAELAEVRTGAEDRLALDVVIGGAVTNAPGVVNERLEAMGRGATTKVRIGSSAIKGPLGFETRVNTLDIIQAEGDLHLNNLAELNLTYGEATTGALEIFAGGSLYFQRAKAAAGQKLILASGGGVHAANGTLEGDFIGLYGFGGSVDDAFDSPLTVDTKAGAIVQVYAKDNINLRETSGDLTLAYAISDIDNLVISGAGDVTAGLLGAQGSLSASADQSLRINRIGGASVRIEDAVALGLVRPDFYGVATAKAPTTATLTAAANLNTGPVAARDRVALVGQSVQATLISETPQDGLTVSLTGPRGGFARTANVQVIGQGPLSLLADPLAPQTASTLGFAPQFTGAVTLDGARIGQAGSTASFATVGTSLTVRNTQIDGNVRFKQRSFSLLTQTVESALNPEDTEQALTLAGGAVDFEIRNETDLTVRDLTLLRRLLATTLAQLVAQDVGITDVTDIVEATVQIGPQQPGTAERAITLISITVQTPAGDRRQIVRLPLITVSLDPEDVVAPG